MISEVVMPQMGADMKEGTILRWRKQEGDTVQRGEIIAEIETDKANIEIEAFEGGTFRKIIGKEGDTMPVGSVIAVIAAPGDDISAYEGGASNAQAPSPASAPAPAGEPAAAAPSSPPASMPPAAAAATTAPPAAPAAAPTANGRLRVSPVARRLAEELGVDLTRLQGSGPDGRILRRDVEAARGSGATQAMARPSAAPRPAGQDVVESVALSRMRQTIARRMQQSKQQAPHYYLTVEVDMTEATRMRPQLNAILGDAGRVSINDLIILATAKTLQRHPRFNASFLDDRMELHSQINIGIAVALDEGLVVPAIMDCDSKGLAEIARDARDVAERARSGGLTPEEYSASTFTISNLGAYGVDVLVAIINPPQVGILGVGAVREKPVVRDGQIVIRSMMSVVLSGDHRATDGAEGARFLETLKQYLESPGAMLL
jgi:pyruvate dehydrogenase E2 component (dihydrolipoamide acetyltransferase)